MTSTQTVDLSDLKIISDADVATTIVTRIEVGDWVRYWNDDSGSWDLGIYQMLWIYKHAGETSPFWGDTRTMAYIATRTGGCTYSDITTITKLVHPSPVAVC